MADFRELPSKCRQLYSMSSYIWYILYQSWYILHISFNTWGYPCDMTWLWLGHTDLIFEYQEYFVYVTAWAFVRRITEHSAMTISTAASRAGPGRTKGPSCDGIYTVCILFWGRYAEYILKLKNLYLFYITFWSCGCTRYIPEIWQHRGYLAPECQTLVYVQVIGYMQTGREFKRIVWICSFFQVEFPTRSHIMYNSWIWLIFGSCLQSAGSYLRCCHIHGIYCISYGISYIYLLIPEDIHGIYFVYDISKYIYLGYDMPIQSIWHSIKKDNRAYLCHIYCIYPDQDTYSIYIPSISYSYFLFTKMGRTRRLVSALSPA